MGFSIDHFLSLPANLIKATIGYKKRLQGVKEFATTQSTETDSTQIYLMIFSTVFAVIAGFIIIKLIIRLYQRQQTRKIRELNSYNEYQNDNDDYEEEDEEDEDDEDDDDLQEYYEEDENDNDDDKFI